MAAARLPSSQTAQPLPVKAAAALQFVDTSTSKVQVLIVCHVHRLYSIKREVERACQKLPGVRTGVVYAGMPLSKNKAMLCNSQPHLVLGTLGRIQSLVGQGVLHLAEEPQLLVDGLAEEKECQLLRQKRVFMDKDLGHEGARKRTRVGAALAAPSHHYLTVAAGSKEARLCECLDLIDFVQVIIFANSPKRASEVTATLLKRGLSAVTVHSPLSCQTPADSCEAFCGFQHRILVTTDGQQRLSTGRVNLVLSYDAPATSAAYLERAGHLGNASACGAVVTLVGEDEASTFKDLQGQLGIQFAAGLEPSVTAVV